MGHWFAKPCLFQAYLRLLKAASSWADALYHFTRPLKTRDVQVGADPSHPATQDRIPAHPWTVRELLNLRACSFF